MGLFSKRKSATQIPTASSSTDSTAAASPSRRSLPREASTSSSATRRSVNSNQGGATSSKSRSMSLPEQPKSSASEEKGPDPNLDPVKYLLSLQAVRERCRLVMEKARQNQLVHFDVDNDKFEQTVKWVISIIKRDYAPDYDQIPPHGRWQHFDVGGRPRVDQLISSWPSSMVDVQERTRRLIDLFLVSVLLDAGAGIEWQYKSKENGKSYNRSEGLAVASIEMFKAGAFSSNPSEPCQVDAGGLKAITLQTMARGLQVGPNNPIEGLEGRTGLMQRLGQALEVNKEIFGETSRPGNMIDYLLAHPTTKASGSFLVKTTTLWDTLMTGLSPIWPPSRTSLNGQSLGDAWPCTTLPTTSTSMGWESIVPFHKLTQWLCYSLMVPMERLLGVQFTNANLLTGLPEYRNGGLLVDTGLLTLKQADRERGEEAYKEYRGREGVKAVEIVPAFAPHDDVVVEWRALTVGYLDLIHTAVVNELGVELNLAQVLEAGTWKGGREIAAVSRPSTKEPPIMIISDGTVF